MRDKNPNMNKKMHELDLDSLEDQIITDDEVSAKLSKVESSVPEIVVDIPTVASSDKVPVEEPLIVKEEAYVLGPHSGAVEDGPKLHKLTVETMTGDSDASDTEHFLATKSDESSAPRIAVEETNKLINPQSDDEIDLSKPSLKILNDSKSDVDARPSASSSPESNVIISDNNVVINSEPSSGSVNVDSLPSSDSKSERTVDNTVKEDLKSTSEGNTGSKRVKKSPGRKERISPSTEEKLAQQSLIERSERLMEAVLELAPGHTIVTELRPHLEGAKRDFESGKLEGLEDTTKQIVLILEDIYVRLVDEKVRSCDKYLKV